MQLSQGTLLQGGKYRIEKVLGQGGFGITYLAVQVGLDRKVAVKEFFMKDYCNRDVDTSHVSVASEGGKDQVERFRVKFVKEARTIASLDNPHLVRIHDVFEENGTAYYVMECLQGGDLRSRIPSSGLPECEALGYVRQLADALSYIHENKILHLDVKPANVLFRKNGEAVLIDFGISKHYDSDGGSQTSSTPVGVSEGYAPMEQYEREGVTSFSASSDIYSLGATLYCLVCGSRPPKASVVLNDGLPELPSSLSLNVRTAISRSMQPRRKDRPQSISEFLALLDAPVVGDGVESDETEIPVNEETTTVNVIQKVDNDAKSVADKNVRKANGHDSAKKNNDKKAPVRYAYASVKMKTDLSDSQPIKNNGWIWGVVSALAAILVSIVVMTAIRKDRLEERVRMDEEKYEKLISHAGRLLAMENRLGAKDIYEKAAFIEEQYSDSKYSYKFNRGAALAAERLKIQMDSEKENESKPLKSAPQKQNAAPSKPVAEASPKPTTVQSPVAQTSENMQEVAYSEQYRLNRTSLSMDVFDVETLKLLDDKGNVMKAKWTSSVPSVATVDPYTGLVTAKVCGETEISALFDGKTYKCKVEVVVEEVIVEEEAIPFQLIEQKPSFQGGDANTFSKWVNQRLVYPEKAKENGIQGRVTLEFTIEKDGTLTKVKVLRGVHPLLDQEAVRVVSSSPKWTPGYQRERAVPVTYTFPVIFQLM